MIYDVYSMPKHAISLTLESENITWLKGRAGAGRMRSVSDLVDQIVTTARLSGSIGPSRCVVGTIDIDAADPLLEGADASVLALFEESMDRPLLVREEPPHYGPRKPATGRG